MDNTFLVKLLISFFIGGLWTVFAMYLADKLGSKIGGLIAGLPSTLLFGLFFIGWTQSTQVSVQATTIVPIVAGINSLFLMIYTASVRFGLWKALFLSFALWAILSFLALVFPFSFTQAITIYSLLCLASYLVMEKIIKVRTVEGKKVTYTPKLIFVRALLSGSIVAISVLLARISGPTLGGMFSMFPAMFTSTLIISFLSHGKQFSAALAKSSVLAAISIVVYSIAVRFAYQPFGLVVGTIISAVISAFSGYLIYRYVITKIS